MITEYARVTFKGRTYVGRRSHEGIGAKNGVRLTRVTADGRDDLRITGLVPEAWEVPWDNVASGVAVVDLGQPVGEPVGDDIEPEAESKPATPRAKKLKSR